MKITTKKMKNNHEIIALLTLGGADMQEITVKYLLTDEEVERLQKITEEHNKQGMELTCEKIFQNIMFAGSKYDIDNKFKIHEFALGLREERILDDAVN